MIPKTAVGQRQYPARPQCRQVKAVFSGFSGLMAALPLGWLFCSVKYNMAEGRLQFHKGRFRLPIRPHSRVSGRLVMDVGDDGLTPLTASPAL